MKKIEKHLNLDLTKKTREVVQGVSGAIKTMQDRRSEQGKAVKAALEQRTILEQQRKEDALRKARKELQGLMEQEPETSGGDSARYGASLVIARVAGQDIALGIRLAEMVKENVEVYNEGLLAIHEETVQKRVKAERTLDRLKVSPYRTNEGTHLKDRLLPLKAKKKGDAPEPRTAKTIARRMATGVGRSILGAVDGALSFGSRFTAAAFQGDLVSIGDQIEIGPKKVIVRGPSQQIARAEFKLEDFQKGKVKITPDWPKFLDKPVSWLSAIIDPEKVESWVPFGQMVAYSTERDKPIGSVPVWWPAKKVKEVSSLFHDSEMPRDDIPDFIPEPDRTELLEATARRAGITPTGAMLRLRQNLLGGSVDGPTGVSAEDRRRTRPE